MAAHGRQPSPVEHMRIRQAATIATRPDKSHRSLSELTEQWRERAGCHVPRERQVAWVASLAGRNDLPLLRSADLAEPILADAAQAVLAEVAERHATFSRMNLLAEAHRLLHGARFASPDERVDVAERVTALATGRSVALAPSGEAHVPLRYQRPDGSSASGPRAGPPTPPRPSSTPRRGCWRRAGTAPARPSRWPRWPPWPTPTSLAALTASASTRP